MNRETWLTEFALSVEKEVFTDFSLAPYRLACGFPSKGATARYGRRLGECHSLQASQGSVHEIFISPTLDKTLDVAGTVCHELAHVAAGVAAGHGKDFLTVCRHVGLHKGRPAGIMPGDGLTLRLLRLLNRLPDYPHKALLPVLKAAQREPSTVKMVCETCLCVVSISFRWLDLAGAPVCGCGGRMLPKDRRKLR